MLPMHWISVNASRCVCDRRAHPSLKSITTSGNTLIHYTNTFILHTVQLTVVIPPSIIVSYPTAPPFGPIIVRGKPCFFSEAKLDLALYWYWYQPWKYFQYLENARSGIGKDEIHVRIRSHVFKVYYIHPDKTAITFPEIAFSSSLQIGSCTVLPLGGAAFRAENKKRSQCSVSQSKRVTLESPTSKMLIMFSTQDFSFKLFKGGNRVLSDLFISGFFFSNDCETR